MGSRIVCSGLVRTGPGVAFKASWGYCAPLDPNTERVHWKFHAYARNVWSPSQFIELAGWPPHEQYSPINVTGAGPTSVFDPQKCWPYTGWRVTNVIIDLAVNHNFIRHCNDEQNIVSFEFKEPLAPKVTLTRTQNVLTWHIDSLVNQMGDSSEYNRVHTRYAIERIYKGQAWPLIHAYGGSGTRFTEATKDVVYSDEPTISPTRPVRVRLWARNDGFSGTSEAGVVEHTFSIPPKPTITNVNDGGGMGGSAATISVNTNSDNDWYPVDKFVLERQVASVCAPNGTWTRVGEYTNPGGTKSVSAIRDGQDGRIPSVDQATWYRVRSIHDEDSNNTSSDIPAAVYVNKPSAPTIQEAELQSDNTIHMKVNKVSNMNADTYVRVVNVSTNTPTEVVPAYKVTDDLSSFLILDGGAAKHFDVGAVYSIEVFNKVSEYAFDSSGVTVMYGKYPTSDVSTTKVRGSAGAIAKALLSTPEITSLTLNPSGRGVTLTWVTGVDVLNMEYDEIGTLIEWTDAEGGWQSTEAPKQFKRPDSGGNGGTVSIDGLTEGTEYKIRLRRYVTVDSDTGYGTEVTTVATPWSTPSQVVLEAPGYVMPGESVRYTWTFKDDNDTPQSNAILNINGFPYAIEGSEGSFVLDIPDSMGGEVLDAFVRVACNGGYSAPSETVYTTVAERPTCTLELAGDSETSELYGGHTVTALPLAVTVGGSGTSWRIRVTSNGGAINSEPQGGFELVAGEVAAHELLYGAGTHELDSSNIITGNYDITCVCIDDTTGMESEPVTLGFAAVWDTTATIPTGTVTISEGRATITPTRGDGADEGETCRIWRKTADGYQLSCENALWDDTHIDIVPPYGTDDLAYVIESIGINGDHAWREIPYTLDGTDAKFTINGDLISLPWNLQPKSTYRKEFERRAHMDGSRVGYWQPGADRDWALSAELVRTDVELLDKLRRLGRYDGIVFVRGPRGVAFAANVDVDMSVSYDRFPVSVDVTCAEVEDDGTYAIIPTPEESDGEGA